MEAMGLVNGQNSEQDWKMVRSFKFICKVGDHVCDMKPFPGSDFLIQYLSVSSAQLNGQSVLGRGTISLW